MSNRITPVKPINVGFLSIFFQLQASSRDHQIELLGWLFLGGKYLVYFITSILKMWERKQIFDIENKRCEPHMEGFTDLLVT